MSYRDTTAPPEAAAYARFIWYLIAAMLAATATGFALTGVRVDPLSRPLLLMPFAVLGATQLLYSTVRPDARIATFAMTATQLLLVLLLGTLLSYAAAGTPVAFRDDALLAIDRALGIDRRAYIAFFDHRPWLYNAVTLAYFAFMPQFVAVLILLFATKQPQRLQQFVFAAGAALLATDLISIVTPSLTTVYLDLGLPVGADIPAHRYTPLPTFDALRSGNRFWIDLSAAEGLISFPSFHTVGAILFVWALSTIRIVRWLALTLNAALLAATPFVGAHYFIDIAGGAAVALCAIAAATWLSRRATAPAPFPRGQTSLAPAE